jgi:hypothetical protein
VSVVAISPPPLTLDVAGGACVCAGSPSAFFPVRAVLRVFVEGHEGAVLHRKRG